MKAENPLLCPLLPSTNVRARAKSLRGFETLNSRCQCHAFKFNVFVSAVHLDPGNERRVQKSHRSKRRGVLAGRGGQTP